MGKIRNMNTFEWEDYRHLAQNDKLKDALIRRAYNQYLDGNDIEEDWGSTERMVSWEMFRAGFIACQAIIDPPKTREKEEEFIDPW